jgi:hypothetical protein
MYEDVEVGALTILRLLDNYDEDNSSRGDYTILGSGKDRIIVIMPGSVPNRTIMASGRRVSTLWEIVVELYIPFRSSISEITDKIRDSREEVFIQFDKYPTLNGVSGVVESFIQGAGQPETWIGETQQFWRQNISLMVKENVTRSNAELT